ncbi:non-ribosomal peptide synthetase [Mycetohabitans endofungorum]|uniref:non-ribosomal peptide synthetase n=1 Tax=Mycetohabitans endofungorum TaxID=417203 RepID=UPI002B053349|nr:non-ribosomal peptide synthetase [Mycetohabitans endofungorum]
MDASITPVTYALTTAQTEIWLAQQLHPDSPVYNIAQYTVIDGAIDAAAFEAALRQVIDEADTLRLQFVDSDDGLRQRIGTPAWSMPVLDLTAQADPQAAAQAWMQADYQQPVNLTQGPLFGYALLKVAPAQWIWYQRYHHIMMDGYGQYLINQRVAHVYSALCAGVTPEPCTFGSVLELLESDAQYQASDQRVQDEAYWLQHCAHWPEPATIASRAAPALQQRLRQTTYLAAQVLGDTASDARRLAQFMTAAMAAYLYRFTGEQDVVLGLPVKARFGADRHIPGMKSNTLPLRLTIRPGMNLSSFMQQAAQAMQSGLQHQRYPSEALRRQLGLSSGQRLFGTTVNMMPFYHDLSFGGYSSTRHSLLSGPVEDLMLCVYWIPGSHQLRIDLNANPACYTAEALGAHQRRFIRFVQVLAADATQPIDSIDLLDTEERHRLLVEWNATQRDYPAHLCVHQLFEAQVERTPKATALVYEDQTLSYTQLNAQANRLAHQLIEWGVKPDARVAICVERSPALVVGLLAILKAGGAYVPLDPTYPAERLAYMVADSAPTVLLSVGTPPAAVTQSLSASVPVLDLYADAEQWAHQSAHNPDVCELSLNAQHLAYVIYTSGSTGQPKGVMVPHQGVANLINAIARTLGITAQDRMLQFAPLSFDTSVEEIFTPLTQGAAVVLRTDAWLSGAEPFWALCERHQVSVVDLPVQFWTQLAQDAAPVASRIRAILIGGEALSASARDAWFAGDGHRPRLLNVYGPTETTVTATVYEVTDDESSWRTIGRPIDNTRLYILDAHSQPVPLGAVGELYIGGAGVARGYLNRPEMTAERFMRDPFSREADARMYKTGDLARYLPDGNIEFLGRNDDQVKIRGFRIELGEIEACLTQHPQVRDAVVLATGNDQSKRLIAYVVGQADESLASTLRAHVASALPEYMVPSAFVRLDAWPLTPNGKLDRRALPAPSADALAQQAYEAPQGKLETTLAQIWAELLGVEQVGRHDSFFALGGHSLLAVRLMNRVAALGMPLPLAALFAAPTLAGLATALSAQCTPDSKCTSDSSVSSVITPVSRDGALPLSFAQQRLWFLAQLDGASDAYHIPLALRVRGPLNRGAWQQALNALLARHEALRSVFISVDGQPQVQLLPAETGVPMTWHDLCSVPDREAQLAQLRAEAAQAPFDLARGPLMRSCGIQLADDEHVMLLVQHHIVSDGWSIEVLVRELNALYRAACDGQTDPLPPLAIQYPDYAAWQRQWLSGERLKAQSEYWRTQLADAPVLLALPTDRPRPAQQLFAGACVPIRIDAQTTRALKRLSQSQDTTLFMTVLAAWSAVLSRLSGQDDLVIGTPSASRHHPQIEPLIGFFVNTLALRVDLSGEPSAAQLLERVRRTTLEAQAHQDLPFEQVVEIVQPPRRLEHTPLFQVMFAWQSNENEAWGLPGLIVQPMDPEYDVAKFDLELGLHEAGEEIVGSLGYATALFERATIERHIGYLQTMLQAIAVDEQQPVTHVELLTPAEQTLLLDTWNATQRDYPAHLCIHQLFEAQVTRMPEATALVYEAQTLSYAQLNAQANRLAHQLIELGVGPDARVALCAQRSPETVVGMLATLKAGGAYVPLDPTYPAERLAYMVADSAPTVLLSVGTPPAAVTQNLGAGVPVLDLHADAAPWAHQSAHNPDVCELSLNAQHLAYVIYTSGSTGQPKGVMVSHRSLVNLVTAMVRSLGLTAQDRMLQCSSLSFDASIGEMFVTLTQGATLVLRTDAWLAGAQSFWALCQANRVSVTDLPTQFWAQLVQEKVPLPDRVRVVMISGDALSASARDAWFAGGGHRPRLLNVYGPTETTVTATVHEVTDDESSWRTIGRPIDNTRLYILDAHSQPVPLGAVGELYIGGAGVARGYLNRPEMTAERFMRDPFSREADARMYKTGDLARYLPDGNIEFLGRNDDQVKIRGFRIEPGEIEACLVQHSQVHDAVVLATGEGNAKRLVAYMIAEADEHLTSTLRAHVASVLPEYMVPAAFVRLDAFPFTPNGKLDRRALPAPDADAFVRQVYEAPQGELETSLAAIWSELLGVEQVGRHDSFFALGGHSLLAVQLIERLRRRGLGISVRALFDTPVLSALAQSLGQHRDMAVPPNRITRETTVLTPELLPLIDLTQREIDHIVEQVPGGVANIQDIYALSPLQDGILFHHLLATDGDPYLLITQLVFDSRERLDQYLAAVQQVVNRHDILRTALVWEGLSTPAQVVWRQAPLSVTELTLEAKDGPIAEQLAQRFDPRHTRLDLTQAPLLRFAIAQDTDGRWIMVQLLHHLIGDHSTAEVTHVEVQAFIKGEGATLPAAQPFRNLVAQARLGLSQAEHERFFTEMLADIDEPTLPFGLAQVHHDGTHVREAHRRLPLALNDRLRAHAKRLGVSLASLCHLAWAQVLARASGQQRVVFGTVLFGRMQAGEGADSAMGLFINTLPLRVDLAGSVEAAVRVMHARLAALLEHEHASLALAQRCSSVPAGTPLFSALLNYRHNAISTGESGRLPGVELLKAEERTNYPLALSVEDFGQALGLTAQAVASLDPDRVCGYMQQVLESLAEALETAPEQPVQQLQALPSEERTLLLQTWNATQRDYPSHLCIHQLFEAQVERTPQAPALVYEDQTLSYAQLNARANRLAHQLIERGVVPDVRVAICVERSPAMVVGLLAILKAGGGYVPLDPAYPGERLAHILTDAAPEIVLADAAGRAALGEAALAHRTVLDPNTLPARAETNPSVPALTSRHLAYVIYTSGSTGLPKGVQNEHRALVNRLVWMQQAYGLTTADRVLQKTSFGFDVSVWEFFWTLLNGATLVVAAPEVHKDPAVLMELMIRQCITTAHFVPSMLGTFLHHEGIEQCTSIKRLICSGEALPGTSVRLCQKLLPGAQLYNLYGPTEAAIDVTAWSCPSDYADDTVPIGRPIANTQIYLLDRNGQPVPLGAVGELYIGGAGVARGYLNRLELTAERFVRDPFSAEPDARMYKTGDLARYLPDGDLEFLGRNDHQVKLRGFRIELGEIEACLARHAQVREAVVLAVGEGQGKRLVAYVVAEPDDALAGTLRTHVAAALPEYMVPSAFVRLDALPLTPNGKLDRRALPVPDTDALAHQAYEAPQGKLETTLAEIWSELLGVDQVGRHDSFFALGGHSLLAVQMISRSRTALGISIAMHTLFETPTLAALAQRVSAQENMQDESFAVLLPIQPHGARPALFCVHPVTGLSWHYRGLVSHLEADQPVYGLQARGLDGDSSPAATIEAMAADYIQQIRRIQPRGPYYLLGWSFGGKVAHSMATQLEQQDERVALLAVLDATPDYVQRDNQSKITEDDFYHLFVRHAAGSLSEAGQYLWEKTRTVLQNNVQLVQRFSPRVYSGDMLFFRATMARDAWTQPISPKVWQPYVMGNVEVHDIACQHYDMELPAPTAQIGRILRQKLNILHRNQTADSEKEYTI